MTGAGAYRGMKVLVMGLGVHGGGLESARFFARQGAEVTITDLKTEADLAPSLEKLQAGEARSFHFILGRHNAEDFQKADMVIKNPGVPPDSSYLRMSRRIETDISIFLAHNPARITAVTGSKGKSSTASAIHWGLDQGRKRGFLKGAAYLGGNITVSPLSFLDALTGADDVVLELSSWQLGDLRGRGFKPRIAVLTAVMPDHQDRYDGMESYVADKRIIYQAQGEEDATVVWDDPWGLRFQGETRGRPLICADGPLPDGVSGGWLAGPQGPALIRLYPPAVRAGHTKGAPMAVVPGELRTPGVHQKRNCLAAALALADLGLEPARILESLEAFPGIEHRLEFFLEKQGRRFYNDSAATVPEAAAAALASFQEPLVLVTGGADKRLDFAPLAAAAERARDEGRLRGLVLLAGTGSDKLRALLDRLALPYQGPFDTADAAAAAAWNAAKPGDAAVLSPGCASFNLFKNEFDRGRQWKASVRRIACGP
jgi:UDP-N-acetylmuramoylalanine--D-glutamate ligase